MTDTDINPPVLIKLGPNFIFSPQVTCLDANHCPGSVMFLFKTRGGTYLHVGDFRACPEMEEFPDLWKNSIDKVFLDTTYCRPEYDFPPQADVIRSTVEQIRTTFPHSSIKRLLICVGSYTIGKERIFAAIAEEFDWKIWANGEKVKVRILDNLEFNNPGFFSTIILNSF